MTEKIFNEYRRKFRVMCANKWANMDRDDLESIFNESLAVSLGAYKEGVSNVTFDTYLRCNLIRAVNREMKRDKGRLKRKADFVDPYSLVEDGDVNILYVDRAPSIEAQVISRETVKDIHAEVDEYIAYKLKSVRNTNTDKDFRVLFDMWFKGYDVSEVSKVCNMDDSKVYTVRKEFKKICRKYLK